MRQRKAGLGGAAVLRGGLALLLSAMATAAQAATLGATVTAVNALDAERQQAAAAAPAAPADALAPLSDSELQGFGCLISGGAATGLTAIAGTDELIKIVAGGTLGPATPIATVVAITGTVFASVCAVGALATPAVMRLYDVYWVGLPQAVTP